MANKHPTGPRKSRADHFRDGTFRSDRHADLKNPEPAAGRPDTPDTLDDVGRAHWFDLIDAFEDMGMLHRVDRFLLYQHCRLYAEIEAIATEQLETRESLRILQDNVPDVRKDHPLQLVQLFQEIVTLRKLVSKATDQLRQGRVAMRQFLIESGLTPASRGRIKLPTKPAAVDPFTAFQSQRSSLARVK